MDRVKELLAVGLPLNTAVKDALGKTVRQFAAEYALPTKAVSNAISGNVRASDALVRALTEELGGTEAEWRELLWQACRPRQPRQQSVA